MNQRQAYYKRSAFGPASHKAEVSSLVRLLGPWREGSGPLFARLAKALAFGPVGEELGTSVRLPSERALAGALRVSRSTVTAAYDLLKSENQAYARHGDGTYFGDLLESVPPVFGGQQLARMMYAGGEPAGRFQLAMAYMPPSDRLLAAHLPIGTLIAATSRALPGFAPAGLPALRSAIAATYAKRGLPTTEDQVLVTTGAQQALYMISKLYHGARAALEEPSQPGTIDALRANDIAALPLRIDDDGPDVEPLVAANDVRLVFLATYNDPTGVHLSSARRERLLSLARSRALVIVEDESLIDVSTRSTNPPPPLAALAPAADVVQIGSLSKLLWSGMRIGWIRAKPSLVARLAALKAVSDLGTPLLSQALAASLLPQIEELRAERRVFLEPRKKAVRATLARLLPAWKLNAPRGGIGYWVTLPHGNATLFAQAALRHGVNIAPGSAFSVSGECARQLRIPFVLEPAVLEAAIERLADAWASYIAAGYRCEAVS